MDFSHRHFELLLADGAATLKLPARKKSYTFSIIMGKELPFQEVACWEEQGQQMQVRRLATNSIPRSTK